MGNLQQMKFIINNDTYVWPYNPTTYSSSNEKNIIKHEYPQLDGVETEHDSIGARTISGTGAFFGQNAYKEYKLFERYFMDKRVGMLVHPVWGGVKARFSRLSLRQEPTPNYVEYDFEFIEHKDISVITVYKPPTSSSGSTNTKAPTTTTYIVKKGDNLWNIAKKYYGKGSLWPKIANANKSLIKNPNLIYPGWKLTIPK